MSDYGFDPKFILTALITIYVSFIDYKEFLEYIVKDERSFNINNFEKAGNLKEQGKIKLDYETYDRFTQMIEMLRNISAEIKSKQVSYST